MKADSRQKPLKLHAYILVADPAWLEASLLSYYDIVEKIVISTDENARSYTGTPLDLEACFRRLRAIDTQNKFEYSSGHYARLEHTPMDNETYQRRCALEVSSRGADWVLQIDSDEVLPDSKMFLSCLSEADAKGYDALEYPARWLYCHVRGDWYLEGCAPNWRASADYPGCLAIKSGVDVRLARHVYDDVKLFRVDVRAHNSDIFHPPDARVDRVIKQNQALLHFSMVRRRADLQKKMSSWSHATDRDWNHEFEYWLWCQKYPLLATAKSPFIRAHRIHNHRRPLRLTKIQMPDFVRAQYRDE